MGWKIRKAEAKDSESILELLKESFNGYWSTSQSLYTKEFWNWIYCDNYGGGSVTLIAEDKNKIVGHFPNVLGRLKVGKNIFSTGTVLHLTTHSDYRRKGIFENLGKASFTELVGSKVPFSLAFPNDKSRPGFINKLGFSQIVTLPLLIRPLRMKSILNGIIKKRGLSLILSWVLGPLYHLAFHHYGVSKKDRNIEIVRKDNISSEEFDTLWEKSSSQIKVSVPRNSLFLNWRFNQRPHLSYQIFAALKGSSLAGYIVTRKADISSLRVGIIMDFLTLPGESSIFMALLNSVINSFKEEEVDLCITACLKNNLYYKAFNYCGFIPVINRFNPRKLVLVGRANEDITEKNLFFDKKNWFITFGDWDVF